LRILHVIYSCGAGGAEVFARDLALALGDLGHQNAVAYYATMEELDIPDTFESEYLAKLDEAGIQRFHLGRRGLRNVVVGASNLRKAIRSFQPDIIHSHIATSILAKGLSGSRVPMVYTHHNTVVRFPKSIFRIFDLLVRRYVAICLPAESMLKQLTSRPVELIRNGIQPRSRPRVDFKKQSKIVLSVGALSPQKDYETLVEVAKLVSKASSSVRFLIAGDGGERPRIERKIDSLGLEQVVTLLGTRKDVDVLMSEANLLLMTSTFEGMPITLIEALYSGLPIIATDVGGCSEIVEEGVNGYLSKPGDVRTLAKRVLQVLGDDKMAEDMSVASREISEHFNIAKCAERHEQFYASVLWEFQS
jgi:glycosyltransferase involved in cell wall biosynthesis